MARVQLLVFLTMVVAATLAPLTSRSSRTVEALAFPGWPDHYETRKIVPLPPAPEDGWLARQFPGRIARFSDGQRQIVLRWVAGPTRLLHPAAQCLRGAGYTIAPAPMRRSADGAAMSCFRAGRDDRTVLVCERIFEGQRSWPDVSAWYWHALLTDAPNGYWSVLEVANLPT
jgi:hypothetical protein